MVQLMPGPCAEMVRLFWFSPIFGTKMLQNSQNTRGPAQRKSSPGITWLVGGTIYETIFQ